MPSRFIDELPDDYIELNNSQYIKDNNFLDEFLESAELSEDVISPGRQRLISNSKKNIIDWEFNQDINVDEEININKEVYHQKYGYGKIIFIDGEKATVNFKKSESKKNIYLKFLKFID